MNSRCTESYFWKIGVIKGYKANNALDVDFCHPHWIDYWMCQQPDAVESGVWWVVGAFVQLCQCQVDFGCGDNECGSDACGRSCGECPPGHVCADGKCQCVPDCGFGKNQKFCGPDGCGGTCGECLPGWKCSSKGMSGMGCTPDCDAACADKQCGNAGPYPLTQFCNCGDCTEGLVCSTEGKCVEPPCIPDCTGKECGDDGCGGSCGDCPENLSVSAAGTCVCLQSWLYDHPAGLADSIVWWVPGGDYPDWPDTGWQPFKNWPLQMKIAMVQQVQDAIDGVPVGDAPPANVCTVNDIVAYLFLPAKTFLTYADATGLFLSLVAQSIRTELLELVPWSLADTAKGGGATPALVCSPEGLAVLFDGRHLFNDQNVWFGTKATGWFDGGAGIEVGKGYSGSSLILELRDRYLGGDEPYCSCMPAYGETAYHFLQTHGLLAENRLETIGRLLRWARHLYHGPKMTPQNTKYFWGYAGAPPASTVMKGYLPGQDGTQVPPDMPPFPSVVHATMGCWGTVALLSHLLRVVNVPVQMIGLGGFCPVEGFPKVSHAAALFPTEQMVLVHGDDPYIDWPVKGIDFPGEQLLVSLDLFSQWFPPNENAGILYFNYHCYSGPCQGAISIPSYPGRRLAELAINYKSPALLLRRCNELLGFDFEVANYLAPVFTESELALTLSAKTFGPSGNMSIYDALDSDIASILQSDFGYGDYATFEQSLQGLASELSDFSSPSIQSYCTNGDAIGLQKYCAAYCLVSDCLHLCEVNS